MKISKYAAIDIGSNAIRILISNVLEKKNNPTFYVKSSIVRVPIRLGEDSFSVGEISKTNIKKLLKTMKAFKLLMKIHGVKKYMVCATSALREANNSEYIVKKIKDKLNIKIQIIDGRKEAEIISYSDIFNYNNLNLSKNYIYIDVGGGSTEFTILKNKKRICSKSFKIGTVRMINETVNFKIWIDIKSWIKKNTSDIKNLVVLGSGGNINKVFKIAKIKEGDPISIFKLNTIYENLKKISFDDRIYNYNLNTDRADVIIPALEIFIKSLKWCGSNKVFVPKIGLSDGMIKLLHKNLLKN
tara:strand:+ start:40456 stop:41355 length:900 start_codon:yes stop_codon:yes gene_type:complete